MTRHVDCFRRFIIYEPYAQTKTHVDSDPIVEYDIKLMGIDSDTPETEYELGFTTAPNEFTRIVPHDLSQLGDSVPIDVNKEGISACQ